MLNQPDDETCDDFERDPKTEAILYKDFLEVGEPVEENSAINNPWHCDPQENWASPGTKYVDGELVFEEDLNVTRMSDCLL